MTGRPDSAAAGGTSARRRTAVVLFNLGGPDRPEAVQPFLFNLFNDPAILRVPQPLRLLLAGLISRRRARLARDIYDRIGGGSPLLPNTEAQGRALAGSLAQPAVDGAADPGEVGVFIAMRYWQPMSFETAEAVRAFAPDEIVLLPLYPQFSTTTTASSLRVWQQAARAVGLHAPTRAVCCYPTEPGWIEALAALIRPHLDAAAAQGRPRLLLSAHGLPQRVVAAGDPYQWQCERTAAALVAALERPDGDGPAVWAPLDWTVCYQSRVGPLAWIGPSTDAEIVRAGADGVPVVLAPIAFVSEHSETLVELDIEYRHLASTHGVPSFARVPTVGTSPDFIRALDRLVRQTLAQTRPVCPGAGGRLCPQPWRGCPVPAGAAPAAAS